MKLVLVPAGKFTMGSPAGEVNRGDGELQHEVEITRSFFLATHTVTQAQYRKLMGTNPSHFCATGGGRAQVAGMDTADFPVDSVMWTEAVAFCKKLSDMPAEKAARRVYRLPSEAEWEHSCRAGAKKYTTFFSGASLSSTQANFDGAQPYGGGAIGANLARTCKVGSYKPNAWGLYDMHGNTWQWCADWFQPNYYQVSPKKDPAGPERSATRVSRGGAWYNAAMYLRAAQRNSLSPTERNIGYGFRVACDVGGRAR
jgi:formylglycine-generating enzyme required for sulfatase activity